jgi:hypothetical protein
MNVQLLLCAIHQLATAPLPVQKAIIKQINFLAKKYNEAGDLTPNSAPSRD